MKGKRSQRRGSQTGASINRHASGAFVIRHHFIFPATSLAALLPFISSLAETAIPLYCPCSVSSRDLENVVNCLETRHGTRLCFYSRMQEIAMRRRLEMTNVLKSKSLRSKHTIYLRCRDQLRLFCSLTFMYYNHLRVNLSTEFDYRIIISFFMLF